MICSAENCGNANAVPNWEQFCFCMLELVAHDEPALPAPLVEPGVPPQGPRAPEADNESVIGATGFRNRK